MRNAVIAIAGLFGLLLPACGGDGNENPPPAPGAEPKGTDRISIFRNAYDPAADLPRIEPERAVIYMPAGDWSYSHHPSVTYFQGAFYAVYSNGMRGEDEPGQRVMIASSPDKLESLTVPEEMMEKIDASDADYYHVFGTLGGMLDGKSYITVSEMRNENGQPSGYLFLCSSGEQLTQFKQQFWSNFLLSACVMLLCASILTKLLMRKLTDPLQKVTDAAQRFGGGDLMVQPLENIVADADIKGIKDEFFVIVPDDEHEGCFLPYLYVQLKDGYTLDDVRDKINACLPERYMRPVEIFTVPERPFFHFKTNRIGLCKEIIAKRNQQKEKAKRNSFADGCIA